MAPEDRRSAARGSVPQAHRPGGHHQPSASVPVRVGPLWRHALTTYRARFPVVAGAAVVVFVPLALLMTAITIWGQRFSADQAGGRGLLVFLATLLGTSVIVLGSAFYAGLLDKVVGEHQHGHHRESVSDILRTLPYRPLVAADLLLSVIVAAGLLLFVLPGVILFTLFALVGPLITIEGQTPLGAFRRSVTLIRPVFGIAFVAVTLPVVLEHAFVHTIEHAVLHRPPFLTAFILSGIGAVTVAAFVGLVEVTLAFALLHREAATPGK
jgi:hypothetical protein